MRILKTAFWAMCIAVPGVVEAKPVLLDFEFGDIDPQPALDAAYDEGIIINNNNYDFYGYENDRITLGNDGLYRWASFRARPGYIFDVLTVDILYAGASVNSIDCTSKPFVQTYAGTTTCDANLDYYSVLSSEIDVLTDAPMEVLGYRGGAVVAQAVVTPVRGTVLDIAALGDFTDLDELEVSLDYPDLDGGWETFEAAKNRWLQCDGGGCGLIQLDNLSLNVTGPSQVPLPAGAVLMIPALAALAGLRRRRNSAV